MKTPVAPALRAAVFATALCVLPIVASATDAAPDRAAQLLALRGSVSVEKAGPYVEIGTYQIQVFAKIGAPSAKLADGTWLYDHRAIEGSDAEGTLIVHFVDGRVSSMALGTPTFVAALRTTPKKTENLIVANR